MNGDDRAGVEAATQAPGLLCRATAMRDGDRHYCTLNTAHHRVHQCGDCGRVWTDDDQDLETTLAALEQERDDDARAVAALRDALRVGGRGWGEADALIARFADRIADLAARDEREATR